MNGTFRSDQASADAGKDGALIIAALNTIVNEYTALTSDAYAGATSITVSSSSLNANGRFPTSLASGDLLMIIQMQGAVTSTTNNATYGSVTNYGNCGRFEFAEVSLVPNATTIAFTAALKNNYLSSGKTQVIRVPRYSSLIVNNGSGITCPQWNGVTGGVVAVESNGSTVINGTIDVSGKGFRGGVVEQNTKTPGEHAYYRSSSASDGAEKGESIAGTASSLSGGRYGRGASANGGGGGNSHNGGGGGGANAGSGTWNGGGRPHNLNSDWTTAWDLEGGNFSLNNSTGGGRGGYTWSSAFLNPLIAGVNNLSWSGDGRYIAGGLGGRTLDYSSGRIFMGGGGGSGDSNNGVGTSGGNGGGIVFLISAGQVSGTGSINANGDNIPLSSGTPGDACGGGGGGGSVIIYTSGAWVKDIAINARGGNGGSQNLNNDAEVEGPGGGGGGGYVSTTNNSGLTINVDGGTYGTTNAPPMTIFAANGATSGAPGLIVTSPASPYSGISTLPVELIFFGGEQRSDYILLEWTTNSEKDNDFFTIEKSSDGHVYEILAKVKGNGNTSSSSTYNLKDFKPFPSNYYKLSQTDYNGHHESLKAIHIDYKRRHDHELSIEHIIPNPFGESLTIQYYSGKIQTVNISLVSIAGRQVAKRSAFAVKGMNTLQWDDNESLSSGIYYLYINNQEGASAVSRVAKR